MCDNCKELKQERDELLEALRQEDGRAAEIFSEYFANKVMVKHLRMERDALLAENISLKTNSLEEIAQAEKDIQEGYDASLDEERAASLKYLKGFCMVCEDRKPCNCK